MFAASAAGAALPAQSPEGVLAPARFCCGGLRGNGKAVGRSPPRGAGLAVLAPAPFRPACLVMAHPSRASGLPAAVGGFAAPAKKRGGLAPLLPALAPRPLARYPPQCVCFVLRAKTKTRTKSSRVSSQQPPPTDRRNQSVKKDEPQTDGQAIHIKSKQHKSNEKQAHRMPHNRFIAPSGYIDTGKLGIKTVSY